MGSLQPDLPHNNYTGQTVDGLNERDREVLGLKDEDFTSHTWAELQEIAWWDAASNTLQKLTRSPSQTRRYLHWRVNIAKQYGSITAFLLQERLRWTPKPSLDPDAGPTFEYKNPTFFADPADFKTVMNDWPYGLERGIYHLIIWTKTPIPVDPDKGDLTDRSRVMIEEYVRRVFRERIREKQPGDKVLWFKNWTALQSVRGVDHVHVLVRDVDDSIVKGWLSKP